MFHSVKAAAVAGLECVVAVPVLAGSRKTLSEPGRVCAAIPGLATGQAAELRGQSLTVQDGDALAKAWAEGRRKWLRLSSHGKPVTAPSSGHYSYVDQPQVAVKAVQRVTAEAAE